jgi:hypothetical protein
MYTTTFQDFATDYLLILGILAIVVFLWMH